MARYAEGTSVSPEASQQEISGLMRRYGADGFVVGWDGDRAAIQFRRGERLFRVDLPIPARADYQDRRAGNGRVVSGQAAYDAEVRRRWRALVLTVKAKLEAIQNGIATFEDEFLAYLMLPDGTTAGPRVLAEVDAARHAGIAPPRLLALPVGGQG
jgi:hypothetical protein